MQVLFGANVLAFCPSKHVIDDGQSLDDVFFADNGAVDDISVKKLHARVQDHQPITGNFDKHSDAAFHIDDRIKPVGRAAWRGLAGRNTEIVVCQFRAEPVQTDLR